MWTFLSVLIICVTILLWSHRYVAPYKEPTVEVAAETEEKIDESKLPNFDKVIQTIYDRLEE